MSLCKYKNAIGEPNILWLSGCFATLFLKVYFSASYYKCKMYKIEIEIILTIKIIVSKYNKRISTY